MKVGIEAISFEVPENYVDVAELAQARGVDPAKFVQGLGQNQMAVPTPCEDTVALAAEAGLRLLRDYKIDPKEISLLIVGTETGIDHSKPVASYVHHILELSNNCRVYETKHACYGAMAGLTTAMHYVLSGKAKGKKALVIASDIARYGRGTPGEPTQGAGSVAMLISDRPRLVEFDAMVEGFFSKQVMDFWRPLYSKEAFVDGHFSIQCYLDALTGSYKAYQRSSLEEGLFRSLAQFNQNFAANLYHVPFVKMAQKAHQRILEIEAGAEFEKESPEAVKAKEDYIQNVAPYLDLNSKVGNIYTGALFLSLINYLESRGKDHAGQRFSLFSYGSGCVSEFMSGRVGEGAIEVRSLHSYKTQLDGRKQVRISRYEEILDACGKMDFNSETVCDPARWGLKRSVLYVGTQDHKRIYTLDGKLIAS
jgi:hydroxymethylglutaryl-CoA synthase